MSPYFIKGMMIAFLFVLFLCQASPRPQVGFRSLLEFLLNIFLVRPHSLRPVLETGGEHPINNFHIFPNWRSPGFTFRRLEYFEGFSSHPASWRTTEVISRLQHQSMTNDSLTYNLALAEVLVKNTQTKNVAEQLSK